jgi:hypothetical protein
MPNDLMWVFFSHPLIGLKIVRHNHSIFIDVSPDKVLEILGSDTADGTTFSFADGHTEYWKWVDQRTIDYRGGYPKVPSPCNQDLYRLQKGTWGKLGYTPSCTPEY